MPLFLKTYFFYKQLVLIVCTCFFVCNGSLVAQPNEPTCINKDASKLYFSKDSSAFMNFYKKIDELKSGKRKRVNIAHYGGSHIQAGTLSEVLMNGFQKLHNSEGGGVFIFPFSIVKTNGPHFYKAFTTGHWKRCRCALNKEMCDNLGMAGVAGITNDSVNTFGFKLMPNNHHKTFNSVKVYHNFNPSFELALNHKTLQFERKDFKNKGYSEFQFEAYIDSLDFLVIRKDTSCKDFMLRGFSAEKDNAGFYYASMGVNGARSNSFLRCSEFVNELKSIPPDLVIFSLGVNDTQGTNFNKKDFIAQYDSMIVQIKKVSPKCAILFTTTTDNYIRRKTSNKRSVIAQEAIFDLMNKHHAGVYDMFAVMGGYKSIYKWYKAGYANKDKVHFLVRGYNLIGNMMFDAIKKSYDFNSK